MNSNEIFPLVPAGWRSTTLGELAKESGGSIQTGPFGSQLHAADYVDEGIPSIMPKNIRIDGVDTSDIARVSPEDVERLAKHKVLAGDVVYSRRGDVEKCCLITSGEEGWLCGTGCLRVRIPSSVLSPVFLHAYLCHPAVREWIVRHAIGATMPNLNTSILSALPILVPPIDEAESVADIWALVSRKISLNTQTNQALEQMAQALFKSWFVDFDPVFDNALDSGFFEREFAGEGIPEPLAKRVAVRQAMRQSLREAGGTDTAAPVIGGLPPETRALFPDSFEKHPELGWIPKGWMVKSLAEQTKLIGGGTPKRSNEEFWGGGIPWFSVKDAPNNSDVFVLDTDEKITVAGLDGSSTRLLPVGTTIISARGTVGKLALVGREMAMNQSCYGVLPADGLGLGVYFNYFSLKRIVYWLRQNTHGAVFDTITKQTFETVSSVVPPSTIASEFERQVTPWLDLVKSKLLENVSLSQLRDTLLPKLLSGELTVFDVCQENQVESKVA
ncbi:restriction endonuclease subunit S [Shewanella algae]|uniref:restriction endonuclease subunit S n=1 Tax=Shewanella algae TaxID=38313 RepID=UPI003003B749